jgi:hypothetical protein
MHMSVVGLCLRLICIRCAADAHAMLPATQAVAGAGIVNGALQRAQQQAAAGGPEQQAAGAAAPPGEARAPAQAAPPQPVAAAADRAAVEPAAGGELARLPAGAAAVGHRLRMVAPVNRQQRRQGQPQGPGPDVALAMEDLSRQQAAAIAAVRGNERKRERQSEQRFLIGLMDSRKRDHDESVRHQEQMQVALATAYHHSVSTVGASAMAAATALTVSNRGSNFAANLDLTQQASQRFIAPAPAPMRVIPPPDDAPIRARMLELNQMEEEGAAAAAHSEPVSPVQQARPEARRPDAPAPAGNLGEDAIPEAPGH